MITFPNNIQSLLIQKTHRFATCWKITRRDSVIYYFTDHDSELTFNENTYQPSGSFSASATESAEGLRVKNRELAGFFTTSTITAEDLHAGLYDEAKVNEYLVDWRYPWAGAIISNVYWIASVRYTDSQWYENLETVHRFLNNQVGRVYGRTCNYTFGDSATCKLEPNHFTTAPLNVYSVTEPDYNTRTVFAARGGLPAKKDGWANFGFVRFTSGENANLEFEVLTNVYDTDDDAVVITLLEPAAFDIAVDDYFTVTAGCDRTIATCRDKFQNVVNYGGFPTVPGKDDTYKSVYHMS